VKVTGWKKWLLILLFLGGFGFAGGGSFLLFVLVPFEHQLVAKGWTQAEIDHTLRLFVYGWFVFSFLVTTLYWWLTLSKGRLKAAGSIALVVLLAAGFVFYEFLHSKSALIAARQGQIEEVSEHLSVGPYPNAQLLSELKRLHYDGVISLLHPAIPFEKILLEEEKTNGAQVGIQIYSVPMLPWISENKEALASIGTLIRQPGKRYYTHCYLGEHRVNLVRQLLGFAARRKPVRPGWHPFVPGMRPGFGVGPELAYGQDPLVTTMLDNFSVFGVSSDGNQTYEEGLGGVHSYFGIFGSDVNLVTYNSSRKLHFTFDPAAPAFQASGIAPVVGSDFMAASDLSGLNYWGRYRDMRSATTAQAKMDLEFYIGQVTYNLHYDSLAVYHKDAVTWLITTNPADIPGNPGFEASPVAGLNALRDRNVTSFGTVNMPMRFEVSLK